MVAHLSHLAGVFETLQKLIFLKIRKHIQYQPALCDLTGRCKLPTAMGKGSSPHHHHLPSLCETYLKIPVSDSQTHWLFFFQFTWEFQESLCSFSLLSSYTFSPEGENFYFLRQCCLCLPARCKAPKPTHGSTHAWPSQQWCGTGCRTSQTNLLPVSALHVTGRAQGFLAGLWLHSFWCVPKCLWPSTLLMPPPTPLMNFPPSQHVRAC